MTGEMTPGILPLCRDTFDVEFARSRLESATGALDRAGIAFTGSPDLLTDNGAASRALEELFSAGANCLLVMQTTFTDAEFISGLVERTTLPIAIWAPSEPRTGGRLRLNAFCGLNLASHALGLRGREFNWLYSDPDRVSPDELLQLLEFDSPGRPRAESAASRGSEVLTTELARNLRGRKIGRVGYRPAGFDTCDYDADTLMELAGVEVEAIELSELFDGANSIADEDVAAVRSGISSGVAGLPGLDQASLDRSLRLAPALEVLARRRRLDAIAIRCWPEMFTEHGGAVCGPVSMLGDAKTPCACEADVYGALSQLVLQAAAEAPVFLADMVDIDIADNTGVVWHCGQAPSSMRDPAVVPRATVHSNRQMPLLFEFPLKPGPVTLMRISKAFGQHQIVLIGGEMLRRPLAFSGTAGVVRFESSAGDVMAGIIDGCLEHHFAIAYGDHRNVLRGLAAEWSLPVLEL